MYAYIYERRRSHMSSKCMYISMYVCMYVYMYVYMIYLYNEWMLSIHVYTV